MFVPIPTCSTVIPTFSRRSRVPLSSLPISFYRPPLSCLRITPSKKGSFCNLARSVPILASSTLGREKEIRKVTAPCRLSYSWCEREGAVPEFANLLSHMAASAVQPVDRRTAQEGCMERGAWSDGESGPARRHGRGRAHVVAVVGRCSFGGPILPGPSEGAASERGH